MIASPQATASGVGLVKALRIHAWVLVAVLVATVVAIVVGPPGRRGRRGRRWPATMTSRTRACPLLGVPPETPATQATPTPRLVVDEPAPIFHEHEGGGHYWRTTNPNRP